MLTLLPPLAAGPLRDFCLGPCVAFFGPRVAILCLSLLPLFAPTLCRLRVAFALSVLGPTQPSAAPHGMFGPVRGLTLLTLLPVSALSWPSGGLPALPVLALAWPSAAPAWALLALLFSTLAPPLG